MSICGELFNDTPSISYSRQSPHDPQLLHIGRFPLHLSLVQNMEGQYVVVLEIHARHCAVMGRKSRGREPTISCNMQEEDNF